MNNKRCRICQMTKSLDNYSYSKTNRDRLKHECKECRKIESAKWRSTNLEKAREASRNWNRNNKDKKNALTRARKALLYKAVGNSSIDQIEARMAYYGFLCAYCRGPFEQVDHVIPVSRGGSNWASNLVPSCAACNQQKNNRRVWNFLDKQVTI